MPCMAAKTACGDQPAMRIQQQAGGLVTGQATDYSISLCLRLQPFFSLL
jgi:hypothetical protein